MIIFELKCPQGHTFEGWFANSAAFDSQRESGFLECPICGDGNIRKAPTAFAIGSSRRASSKGPEAPTAAGAKSGSIPPPVPSVADGAQGAAQGGFPPGFPVAEFRKDPVGVLREMERKMARFVRDNFEDVGTHFAREALKIHYGAEDPRNIRGVSSPEEERILHQEGIQFSKLPVAASPDPAEEDVEAGHAPARHTTDSDVIELNSAEVKSSEVKSASGDATDAGEEDGAAPETTSDTDPPVDKNS